MGGTFNPVHNRHLFVGQSVVEQFRLEKLIVGPNGIPPHKSRADVLTGAMRMRHLAMAVSGNSRMEASAIEIERALRTGQPSFTIDTLQELTDQYDALYGKHSWRLNLVVGEDVVPDFRRWHDAEGIKKLARIIVVPRFASVNPDKEAEWRKILSGADVAVANIDSISDVSSTIIRRMIKAGNSAWRYLVPAQVYDDIVAYGYYLDKAVNPTVAMTALNSSNPAVAGH